MKFLDVLQRYGVVVRGGSRRGEVYLCCPFCAWSGTSPDTRFRLGVNVYSGLAHCYNCGWRSYGSRTFELIVRQAGFSGRLDEGEAVSVPPPEEAPVTDDPPGLPEEYIAFGKGLDDLGKRAYSYLTQLSPKGRGLTKQQIEDKHVGYAVDGRYAYRILFPVYDGGRGVKGVVARDWTQSQSPPYLNSKGLQRILYNLPTLLKRGWTRATPLIVSEGIFDCLAIERAGFRSVATLGKNVTDEQLRYLVSIPYLVLFADRDVAGIEGVVRTAGYLLDYGCDVRIALPPTEQVPDWKDAGDMSVDAIRVAISSAKPFTTSYGSALRFKMARA